MIGKNNKYLRDTRSGVKVESYSIKKFKVGAASVVIGASIFFGAAGVASAAEVEKDAGVEKVTSSTDGKTDVLNNKISTEKEVVVPNKKAEVSTTNAPTVNKDAKVDKATEKQAVLDKTKLQTNIEKVEELLEKINKDKAPASTLAAIKIDLENAKNTLNSTSTELTQAEIDAIAKKLNEKIFVLSSMPKANAPEKVVKEGKNTIANTGSHDSRNGQSMGEGVSFRAGDVLVEGPLYNVKEYISEEKNSGGGTSAGQRTRTIDKTFMTAKYSQEDGKKYITYDVYFQNDGVALSGATGNAFWFYPPRDLLYSGGSYPVGVVSDVYYERYQKNAGATGILSHNPNNFTRVGDRYTVPLGRLASNSYQDSGSQGLWGAAGGLFQMSGGPTRDDQRQQMLKSLKDNEELNRIIKNPNGSYPGASYSHLLTVSPRQDYAYKFHIKVRLRDNVTEAQAQTAGTMAVTAKEGKAFTALQAYVYAATGTRLETRSDAQLYPIKGKEVTKTVGDSLGDVSNPVASDFVVRNDDTKNFPGGMRWNWTNGQPSTSTAGIFKYNVTATYSDNSSNSATATLKVKPKQPVIDQSSVNEKAGEKGQNVVVTVQDGVPDGSTVTLYNGNTVIGTGRTSGQKAIINVSGALPSTAITARTSVQNSNGKVESELSAPATPTEVPDRVAPTVSINGKTLTPNADDNRFIVYRGANFNPTFGVRDDKNNVTLSITGLPKGVANVSTNGSKEFNYTIPGNTVADDAPFGESTATVVATDGRNSATYKFKYRIVDVQAVNDNAENRAIGSELGDPHSHLKVADSAASNNDKYYPTGMQFKWKEFNSSTFSFTDVPNNTKLNEVGSVTKYIATAVFPNTVNTKRIDNVDYTIYTPTQKPVSKTFNVTDTVAPTVKMTNPTNNTESVLGSNENDLPVVEVFRGSTLNIPLKMYDNNTNGKINVKYISGLPTGVNLNNGNTLSQNSGSETNPATATITGRVAANAELGTKVVTLKVSDDATGNVDKGNQATLKFKVKTYDLAFEDRGTPVDDNTRSDVLRLNETSVDPNHYLTTTDGTNRGDGNFGSDMKFRYLKGNEIRETVSFDKIGKHSVKARAYFPNSKTSTKGLPTNPSGLTGDTASVNGRGFLEKTVEFNVKPNTPTLSQPQFNGTAGTRPNVTVGNLPTNAQLQNGATVTVELYQGTTKVASKTVTDRNGTTTLSERDFTTTLIEGQQVHAVVKVSGGQGATAYSVSSDNSENRNVTGYNLVARDIINVKRGETISADELKRFIQVQEGNQRVDLPQGATVTATLDTNSIRSGSEETKTVEATVNFGENRTKKVSLTYKVLNTFPIANTIYDFKDVPRSSGHSDYYSNTGNNIPGGMNWLYKRSGGAEQRGTSFTGTLASDPVGITSYEFIGKYDYSRHTNRPTSTGNLEHSATLVHKVFDITDSAAVTVSKGATLTTEQAKAAVKKADGSDPLPEGTTYEWVESTDTNTPGKRTYKVKVTLPVSQTETGNDTLPRATQVRPSKTINVTVKVKPTAPTITPQNNGDVTITPANETNVNTLNFTYIHPNGSTQNITATKTGSTWSLTNAPADGVTINGNTGVVTIKDRAVKDNQTVTAKSVTAESAQADRVESDTTNGTSPAGDTEKPKFVFNENRKETFKENGDQVVYVTPTETTDIEIGSVTDN